MSTEKLTIRQSIRLALAWSMIGVGFSVSLPFCDLQLNAVVNILNMLALWVGTAYLSREQLTLND